MLPSGEIIYYRHRIEQKRSSSRVKKENKGAVVVPGAGEGQQG